MQIIYLHEKPEVIPEAAFLLYHEFKRFIPRSRLEDVEKTLLERSQAKQLPLALVMIEANRFVGMVSLKRSDLPGYENFSPWLASLYVKPEKSNQGLGQKLVERLILEAKAFNHTELYLYTDLYEKVYQKLGWQKIKSEVHENLPVVIMRRLLA